ncbi:MAG: FxsA family protein, partial [Planctomycetota bacterium]
MFVRLLLLFTVLPLVELALLIRIGQAIEVGPTVGLVILTGLVGAALARHQGLRTLRRIQQNLAQGVV